MNILQRFIPALVVLIAAPLIAEFLLGDFNIRQIGYLGIFIPLYGALALFVRELVRHSGHGWASMLLMALACGLIYEGLVNQTLFNPHFAGASLLKYGHVEALGTSFNYAVFILTLHTVWSISTPIALAEGVAGKRAREPWLSRLQLIGIGLLALLGLVGTAASTFERYKFVSSPMQYGSVVALILILTFLATRKVGRLRRGDSYSVAGRGPSHWVVVSSAFALSTAFMVWFHYAPDHNLRPIIGLAVFLGIDAIAILAIALWSRQSGWTSSHIVAAATGAILTYGWFGMWRFVVDGKSAMGVKTEPIDIVGQTCLLLAMLGLCVLAYRRQTRVQQS